MTWMTEISDEGERALRTIEEALRPYIRKMNGKVRSITLDEPISFIIVDLELEIPLPDCLTGPDTTRAKSRAPVE